MKKSMEEISAMLYHKLDENLFHDLGKPKCFRIDEAGVGHMKGHPIVSAEITERTLNALKYPKQFIQDVIMLVRYHDTYVKTDRIAVHRFMSEYPADLMVKLQILQRADILAHSTLGLKRLDHLDELIKICEDLKSSGAVFAITEMTSFLWVLPRDLL